MSELPETLQELCVYCGISEEQTGREHTWDHFKPRVAGGGNEPRNLVQSCRSCNSLKRNIRFRSIQDCRNYLIARYWQSRRYSKVRRYKFSGMTPDEYHRARELNPLTKKRSRKLRRKMKRRHDNLKLLADAECSALRWKYAVRRKNQEL